MKITLIGYGKMGHEVENMALANKFEISSIIDHKEKNATHKELSKEAVENADVVIDFSSPNNIIETITKVSSYKKALVVGTTGWYDNIKIAQKIIKNNNSGMVYSPNFSIGMNIFFSIARNASFIIDKFPMYDPYIYEMHHNQKIDSPGGTAKNLGNILLSNIKRKNKLVFDRIDGRKIEPDEIHVGSIRAGFFPGMHILGFDGISDNIELRHTARNRAGFAEGALLAAKWINDKKGFYSFEEVISSIVDG